MSKLLTYDPEQASVVMEQVILKGDLSHLSSDQRTKYYMMVCQSIGINPLTKPFEYIKLNGKEVLYALKACTDQLRFTRGISTEVVSQIESNNLLVVHVRVRDADGRSDEDIGVVSLSEAMVGDARANAMMKAVTKAKRRATLSLCGLGMLDETELETIPSVHRVNTSTPTADQLIAPPDFREEARMAADRGRDAFVAFCRRLTKSQYAANRDYLESLKPIVEKSENEQHTEFES